MPGIFIFAGVNNYKLELFEVKPSDGLNETLKQMRLLEIKSFENVEFVNFIKNKFSDGCVECLPGKLWQYVIANFKYIPDDPYDEFLVAPYVMKNYKKGDCDDFSLFIKTALDILGGWFSHYILFSKTSPHAFTHVAVFAHRGDFGRGVYRDPVIIDGTNPNFNFVNSVYKYYKVVK